MQEMINRARRAARDKNLKPPHIAFVHAQLTEPLPIVDGSVDCVLSNCVVNLLPPQGKRALFSEAWRVLRAGGRIVLDDVRFLARFFDSQFPPLEIFWAHRRQSLKINHIISQTDHSETSPGCGDQGQSYNVRELHRGCSPVGGISGTTERRWFHR